VSTIPSLTSTVNGSRASPDRQDLDVIPNVGSLLAGTVIGVVALSVSLFALIVFVIVILVYQQVENYIL
jgi:hypothetical protein